MYCVIFYWSRGDERCVARFNIAHQKASEQQLPDLVITQKCEYAEDDTISDTQPEMSSTNECWSWDPPRKLHSNAANGIRGSDCKPHPNGSTLFYVRFAGRQPICTQRWTESKHCGKSRSNFQSVKNTMLDYLGPATCRYSIVSKRRRKTPKNASESNLF